MNILIANDDGIDAKGIHVLAEILSSMNEVDNVYVCAPDRQRSCCGHALTMVDKLHIKEHELNEFGGKVRWAADCDGVPADCVRLALYILGTRGIKIDLVCAGINMGSNYGTDTFYSGTLAAAREATVCFTQAIAFSLASHNAVHFEHFYKVVPEVIKKAYGKLSKTTILNVNVPDVPEIKGVKVCRTGRMDYAMDYIENEDHSYVLEPNQIVGVGDSFDYDGYAGRQGYITLTPCELTPCNQNELDAVKALDINSF